MASTRSKSTRDRVQSQEPTKKKFNAVVHTCKPSAGEAETGVCCGQSRVPGEPESLKPKWLVGNTSTEQSRLAELRVGLSTMPGVS